MKTIPNFSAYLLTETDIVIVKDGELEVPVKDNKVTLTNDKGEEKTVSLGFLKEMAEPMEDKEAPEEKKEEPKAEEKKQDKAAKSGGKNKATPKKEVKTAKKKEGLKAVPKDKPTAKKEAKVTAKVKSEHKIGDKVAFTPFKSKKEIKGEVVNVKNSTRSPGVVYVYIKAGKPSKVYSKRTQHVKKAK